LSILATPSALAVPSRPPLAPLTSLTSEIAIRPRRLPTGQCSLPGHRRHRAGPVSAGNWDSIAVLNLRLPNFYLPHKRMGVLCHHPYGGPAGGRHPLGAFQGSCWGRRCRDSPAPGSRRALQGFTDNPPALRCGPSASASAACDNGPGRSWPPMANHSTSPTVRTPASAMGTRRSWKAASGEKARDMPSLSAALSERLGGLLAISHKKAPRGTGALSQAWRSNGAQAAALSSVTCGAGAAVAIGIWRGFFASGISRTRSTWSRPFSSVAFFTCTKSASWN